MQNKSSSKRIFGNNIKNTSYFSSVSNKNITQEAMIKYPDSSNTSRQNRLVTSQMYSGSSGITYTPPGFYSPPHTPSSWQMPTTRVEIYKWCLHPDVLVTMDDFRQKKISEINIGDKIIAGDGTVAEVTVTSKRSFSGELKEISLFKTNEKIRATLDHIFYKINNDLEIEEIRADKLQPGDTLYSPTNILHGKEEDFSQSLMKLFSYYISYGDIKFNKKDPQKVIFNFGYCEENFIIYREKLNTVNLCSEIINNEFNIKCNIIYENNNISILIDNDKIAKLFYDSCGNSKNIKYLRNKLLSQKPELLKELLKTYILINIKDFELEFQNNDLLYQFSFLLNSFRCSHYIKDHSLFLNKLDLEKFLNNEYDNINDKVFYKIDDIKDLEYNGPVYDMRVDNDSGIHRFLACGCVVSNCSFWINNEPRVAMAIEFYSKFPINGFELDCPNSAVKEYFKTLVKKINLEFYLPQILREYYAMGDAFVMMEIDCEKCNGQGIDKNGDVCDHEGATWAGISILDPLTVEVVPIPLSHESSRIYMTPNDSLKKIISEARPKEVFERIPDTLKKLVRANQKIPLDPLTITHFKNGSAPYNTYGTSIIRRLFPTLAYRDKLRQAQWIIADRNILPIRVAKVGSQDRPANQTEIDDVQDKLASIANDPIQTLVTYHDFDLDFVGACYSEDTEVLTENGFKLYKDILEDEKIACYNHLNNELVFQKYVKKYIYDYDSDINGPMINVHGKYYDSLVTPNHMMWVKEDKLWRKIRADELSKNKHKILSSVNWEADYPKQFPYSDIINIDIKKFLKFVSHFLSSNYKKYFDILNKFYNKEDVNQYVYSEFYNLDDKIMPKWILDLPKEYLEIIIDTMCDDIGESYLDKNNILIKELTIHSQKLANNLQEILIKLGYKPKVFCNKLHESFYSYTIKWQNIKVKSESIKNIDKVKYNGKVWCLEVVTGLFITRRNGKISIHSNSGKVLQLTNEMEQIENEMVDGFGLTKAVLSGEGPTYSNAQVAIEVLIQRLESDRTLISNWIEEKVFRPIAEFNGFTHKNRRGETEYIYPTVRWHELKLRDNSQKLSFMLTARQNGDVSARTFVEEGLGLKFDNEIENMRLENMSEIISNPTLGLGSGGVDGGGYSGGGPVVPPEMGGGGMPPMEGMGGGMPPGGGGAEGEAGMPPEAAPGGGGLSMAPSANILYENYKQVVADSKDIIDEFNIKYASNNDILNDSNILVNGILPDEPDLIALCDVGFNWGKPGCIESHLSRIASKNNNNTNSNTNPFQHATKLESKLHLSILNSQIPSSYFMQYAINGDRKFIADGAFPNLKIAIEADGETWHIDPEKIQRDRYRDTQLASQGWIVLRFTEDEIEEKINDVLAVILKAVNTRMKNQGITKTIAHNNLEEMKKES